MPTPSSWTRPLLFLGAFGLLALGGCAAWRIGTAASLADASVAFQHHPRDATLRLLIVGDSTAVGTGAARPGDSLAGRLAERYPRLWIDNRARDGALLAEVLTQLEDAGRYDFVLVNAGGNDVIRLRDLDALRADVGRVVARAARVGRQAIVMPSGNVGNAPFFLPPLSWWMTHRSQALHAAVREAAAQHRAVYVDLYQPRATDPFVTEPGMHAADGLHPSSAGYAQWFDELQRQADLPRRFAAAAPGS